MSVDNSVEKINFAACGRGREPLQKFLFSWIAMPSWSKETNDERRSWEPVNKQINQQLSLVALHAK